MTLSIAGTCNGFFKNIPVPDGVFFVTDSRITFRNHRRYDVAPKLFKLSKYAGLVYSGTVGTATYIKKHLKQYFQQNKLYSIEEIFFIFKKRYPKAKLKGGNGTCQMLIGYYDYLDNKTRLLRLEADQEDVCTYSEIDGIHAIGSSSEIRENFNVAIMDYLKSSPGYNFFPINWVNYVSIVLNYKIIETGVHPGIGGLVQTATIDKNGFKWTTQVKINPVDKSVLITERVKDGWRKTKDGIIVEKTDPLFEKDDPYSFE